MSLTSRASVRQYMGYAASNTADDALIDALLMTFDKRCERLLGRTLASTAYSQKRLDGNGTCELLLPEYPVTALTEIIDDPGYDFASDDALTEDDDFTIDADTGILTRLGGAVWTLGSRNIRVSWTGGYAAIPADVAHAANITIADWVTRSNQLEGGQSQMALASENIGGERQASYADEMSVAFSIPKPALDILLAYRHRV